MNPGRPVRAFEESSDTSDYVDFDVDNNTHDPTTFSASNTSAVDPFENINVDGSTAACADMVGTGFFAGMSRLPQFIDPMSLQLDVAPPVAFAASDGFNAFQAAAAAAPFASSAAFGGAVDAGFGDVDLMGPLGSRVDITAEYCDSFTMSPDTLGWSVTDGFQTPIGADGLYNGFAAVDPMAFAGGVDLIPASHEMEQLPSMWVPVSPGLQQRLNSEFAPQLGLLAAVPCPPPVLFLPAEGCSVHPVSNIPSLPNAHLPWNGFPYSPQLDAGFFTVDPSLIVQGTGEVSSLLLPPAGTYGPVSSDTDAHVPNAADQALTSTDMRGFGSDGFQLEPAPRRTRITESLPSTLRDVESNDDDEGVAAGEDSAAHVSLSNDVNDEDFDTTTFDAAGESDPDYLSDNSNSSISSVSSANASLSLPPANSTAQNGPRNRRHEQAGKIRLRKERRREERNYRRRSAAEGAEAQSRKTQKKLLREIEDSKGFAGSQHIRVGEGGVGGRPVRKGARKNYEGLE